MKRILHLPAIAAACVLFVACVPVSTPRPESSKNPASSEDVLKQRAEQRWNLLIQRDGAKAWDYLTPGYRATITRDAYAMSMNNRPIRWTSVEATKVSCDQPDNCTVFITVGFDLKVPGTGGTSSSFAPLRERWLQVQNQWYYLPNEEAGSTVKTTR